jgi:bacillithiol biosynthesis deacetylase BshB1
MREKMKLPEPLHAMALGAHPDDVEISCGGTLVKLAKLGYRVGVLDLTRGEMGTRGTASDREREAAEAGRIMGLVVRENAGRPDGFLKDDQETIMAVIRILRKWRPALWIVPCTEERHPDHAAAGRTGLEAAFLSGLRKIETGSKPFRPTWTIQYFCRLDTAFSFVVDTSDSFDDKLKAIQAYHSQFDQSSSEPQTYISRPQFIDMIIARNKFFGSKIEAAYGEPFLSREALRVDDPVAFLTGTPTAWATLR